LVTEFEERINVEIKKQKKLDIVKERDLGKGSYLKNTQQRCYTGRMMENLRKNI